MRIYDIFDINVVSRFQKPLAYNKAVAEHACGGHHTTDEPQTTEDRGRDDAARGTGGITKTFPAYFKLRSITSKIGSNKNNVEEVVKQLESVDHCT